MGAADVTQFLTDVAVRQGVSASTSNQALSALLFLYRHVIVKDLGRLEICRGRAPYRLPVVLTRDEVRRVLARLSGVSWLVAALLYGAGPRITECLELRVKDVDFDRRQIIVRRGKGRKDRRAVLRALVTARLSDKDPSLFALGDFLGGDTVRMCREFEAPFRFRAHARVLARSSGCAPTHLV